MALMLPLTKHLNRPYKQTELHHSLLARPTSQADKCLTCDALVIRDLDIDVLAGTPLMITNDISVHPAKGQVLIQGSEVITYNAEAIISPHAHAVCRAQSYLLRLSTLTIVLLPGEYLEMDIPSDLGPDCTLANKCSKVSRLWPQPHIAEAVANRVRIANNTTELKTVRHHERPCQAGHTTTLDPTTPPVGPHPSPPCPSKSTPVWLFSGCRQS